MSNELILYFSISGNTKAVAEAIQTETGGDIAEIIPQTPYTTEYTKLLEIAKKELSQNYLPPIKDLNIDLDSYDTIYIGTPVWYGTYAPPIATFLSENDLEDKKIAPFITHGGGGQGNTSKDIAKLSKGSKHLNPLVVAGANTSEVKDWTEGIKNE